MSTLSIVRARTGYVITQKGIDALALPFTCECRPIMEGLLFVCPDCGTVFWKWDQASVVK